MHKYHCLNPIAAVGLDLFSDDYQKVEDIKDAEAVLVLSLIHILDREADAVEQAVKQVLKDGYRTIDIMPQEKQQEKATQVGTAQMGDLICERIR